MILSRYLRKDTLATTFAITGVLILIFLSNFFIRYLAKVADGGFALNLVFEFLLLEVPHLASLLLPLGFFIAVVLVFGRLSVDNEITVMHASGVSRGQLLQWIGTLAVGVATLTAVLTLWVVPSVMQQRQMVLNRARATSLLGAIMPGRFIATKNGRTVFYVESLSRDRTQMKQIFIAQQTEKSPLMMPMGTSTTEPPPDTANVAPRVKPKQAWAVVMAKRGRQIQDTKTGDDFVVVEKGRRYLGVPGDKDYEVIQFDRYGARIREAEVQAPHKEKRDTISTRRVFQLAKTDKDMAAELQWRLSIPLSVLVLTLLAAPFTIVQPRRGKYWQLFPAILIYVVYANCLVLMREWITTGLLPPAIGLWPAHIGVAGIGVGLIAYKKWNNSWLT